MKLIRILAFLLCLACGVSHATISVVQSRSTPSVNNTTVSLAFSSNVTANDLIAVALRTGAHSVFTSCTDSQGSTGWVTDGISEDTLGLDDVVVVSVLAKTTGADTITCTTSSTVSLRLTIHEFTGNATSSWTDATCLSNTNGLNTTSISCATVTSTQANDLLFAATEGNAGQPQTPGNFTWSGTSLAPTSLQNLDASTTTGKIQTWYAIAASAAAYTATGTFAPADSGSTVVVAYKSAPVGGGGGASMLLMFP